MDDLRLSHLGALLLGKLQIIFATIQPAKQPGNSGIGHPIDQQCDTTDDECSSFYESKVNEITKQKESMRNSLL